MMMDDDDDGIALECGIIIITRHGDESDWMLIGFCYV